LNGKRRRESLLWPTLDANDYIPETAAVYSSPFDEEHYHLTYNLLLNGDHRNFNTAKHSDKRVTFLQNTSPLFANATSADVLFFSGVSTNRQLPERRDSWLSQ
jgi:hypothetical protein